MASVVPGSGTGTGATGADGHGEVVVGAVERRAAVRLASMAPVAERDGAGHLR
nr:hypothetical protein GCM10025699_77820 [Microbacterium flavescens]